MGPKSQRYNKNQKHGNRQFPQYDYTPVNDR
jgi:hypothetical protein